MKYYDDYDKEPIGKGNPYYRCSSCKRPVPEINGRLEGHSEHCEYLEKVKTREELEQLKFLIVTVVDSLPTNRDWLDPDIEKEMRKIKI